MSLFSGAGVGDFGLKLAGGKCLAACEIDVHRQNVHSSNIKSPMWGNIREEKGSLIASLSHKTPDLLIATPPCQSFSTANARRGRREDPDHASKDDRNSLFFEVLYVAQKTQPKIIFFENVPNFFDKKIHSPDGLVTDKVIEFIKSVLSNYLSWHGIVCLSKLGVPQSRKRSIGVFVRNDIKNANEILEELTPKQSWSYIHNTPTTILEAIDGLELLDSIDADMAKSNTDILHQVPVSSKKRYSWISDIEADSGKTAWENACPHCDDNSTPIFNVKCQSCGKDMLNRPHVTEKDGTVRSIKGFKTSYKRMAPNTLAPTITTNTNSFSSDCKIHPNQNRVLSVREAALLQTVPYTFNWPKEQHFKTQHLVREMIGEAVPTLVTYQLGLKLSQLI